MRCSTSRFAFGQLLSRVFVVLLRKSIPQSRNLKLPLNLTLGIMGEFFPAQVFKQLSHARAVIERHLAATLDTIHLFGSAIDGGPKPDSDIDLLVTVSAAPNDSLRQALMLDLLKVSSPPGDGGTWRPLELTVVARSEVVPWRYPARRELQFGEGSATTSFPERSSLPFWITILRFC